MLIDSKHSNTDTITELTHRHTIPEINETSVFSSYMHKTTAKKAEKKNKTLDNLQEP